MLYLSGSCDEDISLSFTKQRIDTKGGSVAQLNRVNSGKTNVKTVIALIIFVLFLLFLLQNTAIVEIQFLFWQIKMSRVLLLLGSVVLGGLIGLLIGWEVFGRKAKATKKEDSDRPFQHP